MKKILLLTISLLLLGLGCQKTLGGVSVFSPQQGGTGTSTASVGDVGKFLRVSNNSPLTFDYGAASGGGSSTRTSTANFLSFYDTPTTTTGTPNAIDTGSGLVFTNATSSRFFATDTLFISASTTRLFVSSTLSVATSSKTNIAQFGSTLTVDDVNRGIVVNGIAPYNYGGTRMALTIYCNGTYSCLALDGAQALIKWKCAANSGNCAELYTDGSGNFLLNIDSGKFGFQIMAGTGAAWFGRQTGSNVSFGPTSPAAVSTFKVYITGLSLDDAGYAIYVDSFGAAGKLFGVSNLGNISASGTLKLMQNGGTSNGLFYVNTSGSVSVSGTLRVFRTSTLADIMPSSTLTYTMGASSSRWLEGWFGTVNLGTSTYSISQLNGGLTITDQPNGAGNARLTINADGSVSIPGSLDVGGCTGCGVGGGGLGVDYPAIATSSFLGINYPTLATSTFVSYTGATQSVNLGAFGITFTSATGTTSTISYINATNVTTTGLVVTSLGNCNSSNQAIQSTNGVLSCGTLATGGGTPPPGVVATSTANYFAYYMNATTVTGTSEMAYMNGTLRISTSTVLASTTLTRMYIDNNSANGGLYSSWPIPINTRTSTTVVNNLSESQCLPATGVANFTAIYSDDETRILTQGTAANGALTLHTGHLSSAATAGTATYSNANVLQTITPQTMGSNKTTWLYKGAVTWNGYHAVIIVSSTPLQEAYIKIATSSFDTNIAAFSSWVTSTISGRQVTSSDFIIGIYNDLLYVATSTTQLVTYSFNTSTRTFTSQSNYTCSGANMLITNTRANSNGLYIGFSSAPFVRKYDGTCATKDFTQGGGKYQAAPATTGPDLFASKFSIYGLQGTANSCKFKGW